jgi:hypothetical protein
MSRHASAGLVLCVEPSGAVNVERADGNECEQSVRSGETPSKAELQLTETAPEHCPGCVDVPFFLGDTTEPCESAVVSSSVTTLLPDSRLALPAENFAASDRWAARVDVRALRPRDPASSVESFRRHAGHLFSDTSVVRARSSVELLI